LLVPRHELSPDFFRESGTSDTAPAHMLLVIESASPSLF